MKLVAAPDGAVDRYDRAIWLTLPFDMSWVAVVSTAPYMAAAQVFSPGVGAGEVFVMGAASSAVFVPGLAAGQVSPE